MDTLPIIDLSLPEDKNAPAVHVALRDVGFMYIQNHEVPQEIQRLLYNCSKQFFSLEEDVKKQIAMEKGGASWRGYFPFKGELTSGIPDLKEGLYFGIEHGESHPEVIKNTPMHGPNQWPEIDEMKPTVTAYLEYMANLGNRIMRLVALGLGLEREYFSIRYGADPTMLFRIFNYPYQEGREGDWGVQEHSDMGFLTILLQDENGGLEIKSRGGDSWISAPPIPGTFVINIGDMLELWTHGIYQATLHRVRNTSGNDRMSFPFFFDPSWNSRLIPIDSRLLRDTDLNNVPPSTPRKWDEMNIRQLSHEVTYGEFVWGKVKDVFPSIILK